MRTAWQILEYVMKKTLYQKIWDSHLVIDASGQAPLLYVDRHLMHEVTSPQAFEGLRLASRKVRNPQSILATMDHCVPTQSRKLPIKVLQDKLMAEFSANKDKQFIVNPEAQQVNTPRGNVFKFEIDSFRNKNLLSRLDDTGLTLKYVDAIERYDQQHKQDYPWLWA